MELISTYIETSDFDKSIEFYKNVLQIEPFVFCEGRWVVHNMNDNCMTLFRENAGV